MLKKSFIKKILQTEKNIVHKSINGRFKYARGILRFFFLIYRALCKELKVFWEIQKIMQPGKKNDGGLVHYILKFPNNRLG